MYARHSGMTANRPPSTISLLGLGLMVLAGGAGATPEIQTWQTGNGARVLFVAAPELPMVDLRVTFGAGSARDGEKPGLASMTTAMLTQGARDWDADAIALRMEGVGAQLSSSTDRDRAELSIRSLTQPKTLEVAVETLAAVLATPTFEADDLERLRRNTLIGLRQDQESPRTVAQKAFYRAVFGGHPYASDPTGTEDAVRALTRADLLDFHRHLYTGSNAQVAVVGDLDRATAESLAEQVVGSLPIGERPSPLPKVLDLESGASERILFPSTQTTVLAGQPGMRRGDPDYFALYVGNHILGGSGLVSLLMEEVREKRGLSYSTYSYFLPLAQPGPFLMGLQTRNDQAEQAREVMIQTLRRFLSEGPSAQELTAAKKNLTGGFPLRIASNDDILGYLAVIGFYGLPLDYLDRFVERIEAVDAEQIRSAFARRVDPDRLAIVTVGGEGTPQVSAVSAP